MNRQGCDTTVDPLLDRENPPPVSAYVINRREIAPLLERAQEVVKSYQEASGCGVSILDSGDQSLEGPPVPAAICGFCRIFRSGGKGYPCKGPRDEGITEARRKGAPYIYLCELGLAFWISPIYSRGRYAGALLSGGVLISGEDLASEERFLTEKLQAWGGGALGEGALEEYLGMVLRKTHEEIQALARLLRLCADRVSQASGGLGDSAEWPDRGRQEAGERRLGRFLQGPLPRVPEEPIYPLDKERTLLAALRRGDNEMGRKILKELLDTVLVSNPGNFEFIRLRAIEMVVLLSRAAVENTGDSPPGAGQEILEQNNRWFKRIQESENMEALTTNLQLIVERMAAKLFSFKGVRHASALRKAERYIWENYARKISLQEIAAFSGLSAPYFSTIFKEEMGENFSAYLNRLRVQKAAAMMVETGLPLNEIAAASGFEDQSWFSKIFKYYTGMSPGKYRGKGSDAGEFTVKEENNAAANT